MGWIRNVFRKKKKVVDTKPVNERHIIQPWHVPKYERYMVTIKNSLTDELQQFPVEHDDNSGRPLSNTIAYVMMASDVRLYDIINIMTVDEYLKQDDDSLLG